MRSWPLLPFWASRKRGPTGSGCCSAARAAARFTPASPEPFRLLPLLQIRASRPRHFLQTVTRLRREKPEAALLLPPSFSSAWMVALAGIRERVGWSSDGRRGLLTQRVDPPPRAQPLRDQYAELAERLLDVLAPEGAPWSLPRGVRRLPLLPEEFVWARQSWERFGLAPDNTIVLAPGATFGATKRWPEDRFVELGRRLLARGRNLLWIGGEDEMETCDRLARLAMLPRDSFEPPNAETEGGATAGPGLGEAGSRTSIAGGPGLREAGSPMSVAGGPSLGEAGFRIGIAEAPSLSVAGRLTVRQSLALLAGARAAVSNDSGALHLAQAAGCPVLGIYGSTSPRWTGPGGDRQRVLYDGLSCSPCFSRTCPTRIECLDGIDVDRVERLLLELFEETREPPGRPAIFLDRDGTVLDLVPYLSRREDARLAPGAANGLRALQEAGFALVVITNQSAVARGLLDREGLWKIHRRMEDLLAAEGVRLDGIEVCPHHPDFTGPCACRKPEPGLFLRAAQRLDLNLSRSFTVGDSVSDLEAGLRAGTRTILVRSGYGREVQAAQPAEAAGAGERRALYEWAGDDLEDVARWILSGGAEETGPVRQGPGSERT